MTALTWLALAGAAAGLGGRGEGRFRGLAAAGRVAASERRVTAPSGGDGWPVRRLRSSVAARRRGLRAALAALAGDLVAGGRPASALGAAAGADPAYAELFRRAAAVADVGGDVAAVLREDPATHGLAGAWNLAEQAGAPLAAVVERVAADLDAAEEQRRAVAVALAGPRSSAAVLALLPALGLLLGATMGGRPLAFLIGSPAGLAVGAIGIGLDLLGLWWMQRILRWASR